MAAAGRAMHKGFLKGVLAGAVGGMCGLYWLDPSTGRRRRARVRDQFVSLLTNASHGMRSAVHDLAHRAAGLWAGVHRVLRSPRACDAVVVARARAALGRVTSHPAAVHVSAVNGHVLLTGAVLRREHGRLREVLRGVRGVTAVQDALDVFDRPDHVSALQGGRPRLEQARIRRESWPPALRLIATAGGATAMLFGIRKGGLTGTLMALAGGALALRGSANAPLSRITRDRQRHGIDVHKSLQVAAPPEQVFEALTHCRSFPLFMHNVQRVSMQGGRSHWVVAGPAGIPIEWDAETTVIRPNEALAWHTVGNATVAHAGIIHLERRDGGTRLDLHMTYSPPAGRVGHLLARLFGADAKSELDEDLVRLKTFIESNVSAADSADSTRGSQTLQ